MSRSQIDRLTRRIEALEAQRKPPEQRVFTVLVKDHMRRNEEVARFCAEHGVTNSDLVIVRVIIPFETRPGETAKEAYERELRAMARNDDHGRKSQEALLDTAEPQLRRSRWWPS
jgi:hypothetical protein